jgi:hypothetical protein
VPLPNPSYKPRSLMTRNSDKYFGYQATCRFFVLALVMVASPALSQSGGAPLASGLSTITVEDVQQGLIAFVNISSAPGLSGAVFNVDDADNRQVELLRSSLGYSSDITQKGRIFDWYTGAALAAAELRDDLLFLDDNGAPMKIEIERTILSARLSGGLSLPVTRHFKIRPYMSLVGATIKTDHSIISQSSLPVLPIIDENLQVPTRVNSYTLAGTIDALYDRWYGSRRIELTGSYMQAYTSTFDAPNEVLNTEGWSNTLQLKARWSGDTGKRMLGRPWRWNLYGNYTTFLDQPTLALGFSDYFEAGVGIDYEINLKVMDWFGIRFVGFRAGAIFGKEVNGYSLGFTFQ